MATLREFQAQPLAIKGSAIGLGAGLLLLGFAGVTKALNPLPPENPGYPVALRDRVSVGEDLLVMGVASEAKLAGIQAFGMGHYLEAIQQFQSTLLKTPNDPETLIYLNNARALLQEESDTLRIAVGVPIGKNPQVAQEILRGVAQAQEALNETGINSMPLVVELTNDDNDEETAKAIAQALVQDPKILAVVGHNSSKASVAAAPIYQAGRLVMISPTSFSSKLSNAGSFIFRTISSSEPIAQNLAHHITRRTQIRRLAICYDSQSPDSNAFRAAFTQAFTQSGGTLLRQTCSLADNPERLVESLLQQQTQGAVLIPNVDQLDKVVAFAKANRKRMPLFSSPTLYATQPLQQSQGNLVGLTLSAPWYADQSSANSFLARVSQRWGEDSITWRTATAYDATTAIAQAIHSIPPDAVIDRIGIQQALRSPDFSAQGSGELLRFLPSGDRQGQSTLVQAQQRGTDQYQFVAIEK